MNTNEVKRRNYNFILHLRMDLNDCKVLEKKIIPLTVDNNIIEPFYGFVKNCFLNPENEQCITETIEDKVKIYNKSIIYLVMEVYYGYESMVSKNSLFEETMFNYNIVYKCEIQ